MTPEEPKPGWTVDTLYEHFNSKLEEMDKRYLDRFESQEKAVKVSESNADRWRDSANEWRGAMTDKDRDFVRKDALHEGDSTGRRNQTDNTRANLAIGISIVMGFLAMGSAFLAVLRWHG